MKRYWKYGIIGLGALAGFAYFKFIGCRTGVCPITSNPWISTGYGALLGFVLTLNSQKKTHVEGVEE